MALKMQTDSDGDFVVLNGKRHNLLRDSTIEEGSPRAQALLAELDQLNFGPRWNNNARMRICFGCQINHGPDSAEWKNGFARFVNAEKRWAAKQDGSPMPTEPPRHHAAQMPDGEAIDASIVDHFAATPGLRRAFGVNSSHPEDAAYINGLRWYAASAKRMMERRSTK